MFRVATAASDRNASASSDAHRWLPLTGERIYLAARTGRKSEMQRVARELARAGSVVVSSWIDVETDPEVVIGSDASADVAAADLADLCRATVCIAFTEAASAQEKGRGGRHVELGVSIGLGLRTIVVGPPEHVFHCLPEIERYGSWAAVRKSLLRRRSGVSVLA